MSGTRIGAGLSTLDDTEEAFEAAASDARRQLEMDADLAIVFASRSHLESIEEALRRFKKECERNGIMQEIKRREYYESPSVRRKKKAQEARRKMRRRMMKQ